MFYLFPAEIRKTAHILAMQLRVQKASWQADDAGLSPMCCIYWQGVISLQHGHAYLILGPLAARLAAIVNCLLKNGQRMFASSILRSDDNRK